MKKIIKAISIFCKNVIRLKYKFNTSDKSKYELDDKYGIFEQGEVVNSLLFKIIN